MLRCSDVLSVLKEKHDHFMAGHSGIKRTFDKIKYDYYWSGYYDTVHRYGSSCQVCQNFGPRNPPVPLTKNLKLAIEGPFTHVAIGYIYLPLTSNGNNFALVMIDKFTGWVECKPTPTQSANFTCVSLLEWISQYGLMVQVHCDNGTHFNAEEVKVMVLPAALYVMRTNARDDHGYSAFFLAYGRNPRSISEDIDNEV